MPSSYAHVLAILGRNRRLLALTAVVAVLESGLLLAYPWLSKVQLEALEGRHRDAVSWLTTAGAVFLAVVVLVLVAQVIGTLVGGVSRLVETLLRERLSIDADQVLYDQMERLDAGFLENPRNRRLIFVFFDISHLPGALVQFLGGALKTAISVVAILPILAVTDLTVCGIIAGFGLLQVWLLRLRMRRENAYRLYKERQMSGINELIFLLRHRFHQLLGATGEERIMPRFWAKRREALALEVRQTRLSITFQILNRLVENLSLFAAAVVIGQRVLSGHLSLGAFVMVTLYASQLQSGLTAVNAAIDEWFRLRSVFLQLGFFLTMKPRVAVEGCASPTGPLAGDVVLEDVAFRYPRLQEEEQAYIGYLVRQLDLDNQKREVWPGDYDLVREWEQLLAQHREPFAPVLRGVTATFRRGAITALVGRNGSGKTTLMKLLTRSYDPEAGRVTVAGRPLTGLLPRAVRHHYSMVTQEPFLLDSFSVRENALLGCDVTDDAAIWAVIDRLGLGPAVRALPRGLDTILGDEITLSGGQAQLLVIARTLLQRRPFVVLDEGTNQLDAEKELGILQVLQELKSDATVILITHRMTTARKADHILVLDEGRIVEEGRHEDLVTREGGLYRQFWEIQVVQ